MTNYTFDAMNNTLTVTNAFLKKAGIFNSAEYNLIKNIRLDYPTVKIIMADKKKGQHHITFAQMAEFIAFMDQENKTDITAQYAKVKALSKIQPSPYNYVKTWFERTFPNYTNQVDFVDGKMVFVEEKKDEAKQSERKNELTVVEKAA